MQGYIKDHRKELESDIWLMPPLYHRVWQYLKYMANHKDNEIPLSDGTKLNIKSGQHLTSIRNIAKGVSWYEGAVYKEPNPKTVSKIIEWLVKMKMIEIDKGRGNRQYTLITLLNWGLYQEKEEGGNSKVTARGEGRKQLVDINNNDKECLKNEKKKTSRQKQVYDEASIYFKLAKKLHYEIKKNLPEQNEPNYQSWANDMRKLIEIDKRDPQQVIKVIEWVQKNNFWWKNVLSPSKLRKQYERLLADAKSEQLKKTNKEVATDPRDRELAFHKWVSDGNDPEEFNWSGE